MRRESLTEGKLEQLGILFAACANGIDKHTVCKYATACHYALIICKGRLDLVGNTLAVLVPVGLQILAEILDRLDIVVRKSEEGRCTDRSLRRNEVDLLGFILFLVNVVRNRRDLFLRANAVGRIGGQIEVAPVDARTVALAVQYLLALRTHFNALYLAMLKEFHINLVVAENVHTNLLGNRKLHANGMLLAVKGLLAHLKIGYRTGEIVKIVGQKGSGKEKGKANTILLVDVGRRKGINVTRNEVHRIDVGVALSADDAIGLAVDLGNTNDDVGETGPVGGIDVGQLICG